MHQPSLLGLPADPGTIGPTWLPMVLAPRNATEVEVLLPHGSVVVAHWACGGGEEQPPFRGWFTWCANGNVGQPHRQGESGYFDEVKPLFWRRIERMV